MAGTTDRPPRQVNDLSLAENNCPRDAADADADADADVAAAFPVVQTRPRKFPNGARKSAVSRWNSKRARAHFVTPTDANRVDSFATVE